MMKINSIFLTVIFSCCCLVILPLKGAASENPVRYQDTCAGFMESYPSNVYFGDTHLHTTLSIDANWYKNSLGHEEAYRFARGETVIASSGAKARLRRPLDFLVIADHAENLGLLNSFDKYDSHLFDSKHGREISKHFKQLQSIPDKQQRVESIWDFFAVDNVKAVDGYSKSVWDRVAETADSYNQADVFTAFIGFEWTSLGTNKAGNLHRVVVFKEGKEKAAKVLPFSAIDSDKPEDLWEYMRDYHDKTGGDILAIPHNGNVSNGEMFPQTIESKTYANARQRWEPLYEVTQMKGDGETHPALSPEDPYSDFETWDGWSGKANNKQWDIAQIQKKQNEYARSALMTGLKYRSDIGVNPFKFGMIGSTDSHTSLATADDNNFWGKFSDRELGVDRLNTSTWTKDLAYSEMAASGYAAVWAERNTRKALFESMQRKEVYATTGPRITLRFYGGWNFVDADKAAGDLACLGYRKGVPMGSDLTNGPKSQSPGFLIRATKDPDGANLERIQVVKGWLDNKGRTYEKVFDVVLSDAPLKNNTSVAGVGHDGIVYTSAVGAAELTAVWHDLEFNAEQQAFYYVRVLEIPTPRWTAYDAELFEYKKMPDKVRMTTQERAYSSPIWYTP